MTTLKLTKGDWPNIDILALPQNERAAASYIQVSLHELYRYVEQFAADLALFDESSVLEVRGIKWGTDRRYIAARDGAMAIYNFAKTTETFSPRLKVSPTLSSYVDHQQLRSSCKALGQLFPHFEGIRHSVAHSAELRNERQKHQIRQPVPGLIPGIALGGPNTPIDVRNTLRGRTFMNTFKGKLQTYEMSLDTLAGLKRIKDGIYQAFRHHERKTG